MSSDAKQEVHVVLCGEPSLIGNTSRCGMVHADLEARMEMREVMDRPEESISAAEELLRRPRYEVQLARVREGWTARCYHEDGEHVWSSEDASTVRLALSEIARAIEEDT